jgi:HD superfamily phosphodiesterase
MTSNETSAQSYEPVQILEPGHPLFLPALQGLHRETSRKLDALIHAGIHEPGHGSSHIDMVLHYFFMIAEAIGIPAEYQQVGALAAILHDSWRENVHDSHVDRSAETAVAAMRELDFLGVQGATFDPDVEELVVALVRSHSIHSNRAQSQRLPVELLPLAKTVQIADMYSSAGALGLLRAFSYSGHVFKSLLSRVKTISKNTARFQAPLPPSLKRILGESDHYFHLWVLSIMLRTNRNFIGKFSESEGAITGFMERGLRDGGIDPRDVELATGLRIIAVDGSPGEYRVLMEQAPGTGRSPLDIISLRKKNKACSDHFEAVITGLDALAATGLRDDGEPDPAVLEEILCILDQGMIGLCSRAFWCQLNPQLDDGEGSLRYLCLEEQIVRFVDRMKQDQAREERSVVRSALGRALLQRSLAYGDELAREAQHQLAIQRWTPQSWARLGGVGSA